MTALEKIQEDTVDSRQIAMWALVILAAVFSVIAVVITVFDKMRARNHGQRVSESTLIFFASLGGATFMFITMLLIHHKTRHVKFMLGLPLMMLYQALIVYLIVT